MGIQSCRHYMIGSGRITVIRCFKEGEQAQILFRRVLKTNENEDETAAERSDEQYGLEAEKE